MRTGRTASIEIWWQGQAGIIAGLEAVQPFVIGLM
jgi:hypothetical protein